MKLHPLRYLVAIEENGFNITTAAQRLHTSQPGASKQLKLLEEELGFHELKSIKRISEVLRDESDGKPPAHRWHLCRPSSLHQTVTMDLVLPVA